VVGGSVKKCDDHKKFANVEADTLPREKKISGRSLLELARKGRRLVRRPVTAVRLKGKKEKGDTTRVNEGGRRSSL